MIRFITTTGLKQVPRDTDFHITPVLTFVRAPHDLSVIKSGKGIMFQWGHWAVGIFAFKLR